MKTAHVLGMATFCVAAISSGCGGSSGDPEPTAPSAPSAGAASQSSGVTGTPSVGAAGTRPAGAAGANVNATAGSSGSPSSAPTGKAGSSAPVVAGSTGSAAGSGGSVAVSAGSSAAMGGAVAAGGGSGGAGGVAGGDIPTPMTAPLVWGFGIGITDVPAASKFYSEVMKMTVVKDAVKRDDSTETFMYGTQAMRGARLLLMKFDDMRNTRKITAKLVWQSSNASAVDTAASMYPDYNSRLNFGIVQFDGPETYIQEVGGSFDDGGTGITVPYPIALGFAVSDQPASRKFYTSLGMTESSLGSFSVTDATGTGTIGEYTVKFDDGMGVVLQQWTPARPAKDNPVKVVMFVPDAQAMADKVMAGGGTIVKPAERTPVYDNRLLVVAKDLDGYVLDIVE